jgi:spore coat polysaccharide biosynthesis predicted glycosyltransferase SpsG
VTSRKEKSYIPSQYYSIRDEFTRPKSVQIHRHVIMVVGGSGEKYLLKVIIKYADKYNHP